MASDLEIAIETLRGAVTECRFENVRYRQDQFHALHGALREKSDAICQAIAKDSSCSIAEAETEFFLAMDAVQKSYDSLNFEKALEEGYYVTKGKNNEDRRAGLGLVAIRPQRHTRFYSVVSPIAAALAAGNCILVQLDNSSQSVDALFTEIVTPVMDSDTFHITSSQIEDKDLAKFDLLVDQTTTQKAFASSCHSTTETRTIAVVDRTSTLETAAKAIATARLSPNNTSPYSPDLVIVNEYIKDIFSSACLQYASNQAESTSIRKISQEEKKLQTTIQEAEIKGTIKIHRTPGTDLNIIELLDSTSPLIKTKIQGPYILLLSSTGLVDTVITQRSTPLFLATYLFASPSAAKFLSEQIPSHASYINQIPPQLLFGPPSPTSHPHTLHPRYTPAMLSAPRPQFVAISAEMPDSLEMKKLAAKELKPTGQKPGHAVGFFEQGILIGLGSAAVVVLPAVGWGVYWVGRRGLGFVRGLR
ncbi:uncharacterized protein LY89DRAFT_766029 [Mollisia scopiformis]|uniref:Aldehyde dehydrogenase domain-containing protein n=1 Tax=Mollisia scopiformis TaxID=149040 RepID=A0A132B6D8_MOLSC|nr:uncharacterized protein LY89DRAFT_766029 [Mollisia scopiformis]KUJ07454.1 hypothetical protein LY89DRAFT_766029 [Mollisia scopiformis]